MSNLAFTLIVLSAVMHASYNVLVKRSRQKTVFIWWMFVTSMILFTAALPLAPDPFRVPAPHTVLMIVMGAVCYVLYHLFNGRAYQEGDLSVVYPLGQSAMIYVPIWGALLLGEHLSRLGLCGILLVVLGTFSVPMQRFSLGELGRPFRDLRNRSVQAALVAGFIYSLGAVAEKSGVKQYSPLYFTYLMVLCMLALMSFNLCRPRYHPLVAQELKKNWLPILFSGPLVTGSFLCFRYGLNLSPVGYAVPVRQVSVLIGVLIGILFLKESCGRMRLISALLILSGAVVIRLG